MKIRIIVNCLLMAACAYLFYVTSSFNVIGKYTGVNTPEFWPRIVLGIIAAIAAISLVLEFINWKRGIVDEPEQEVDYKKLVLAFTLAVLYFIAMQYIGFILATLIFQCAFLFLQGVRKISTLALTPLVLTTLVYVLFVRLMSILLPRGVGMFREFSLFFY